ncbi:MAG: CYTH domain-containing protein [Candidatus Staskawiczbacteria bacterium]|nr:CYTH domain-containing protein [Candidatus Staskawiczbacteria bacterium]
MAKIEVEHRGLLTEEKFKELNKYLKDNGKFLSKKDRFSLIYYSHGKEADFKLQKDNPIDVRLRITNKKSELVLKHGAWGGKDARKEFSFPIDSKKFEDMIELLQVLGLYYGGLQATKTMVYLYKGVEFALVKVPGWGYYFEAEISVNPDLVDKANKKMDLVCHELKLEALDEKSFYNLCEELNQRSGFTFDLKKEKFSDIKKRFKDYF